MLRVIPMLLTVVVAIGLASSSYTEAMCKTEKYHCPGQQRCTCCNMTSSSVIADCSNSSLIEIPEFGPEVVVLRLRHNYISKIQNRNTSNVNVEVLDLSNNFLSVISDTAFTNFRKLKMLSLNGNKLSYTRTVFHQGVFRDLVNLQILDVKNNMNLSDLQNNIYPHEAFGGLSSIECLKLDGIYSPHFGPDFKSLSMLTDLDISGKKARCFSKYIRNDTFIFMTNLKSLDVSYCNLVEIQSGSLRPLSQLLTLDISNNEHLTFRALRNITCDIPFTSVTSVKSRKLYCTYGIGTYLTKNDIACLQNTSIESIYFDRNRLEMIEEGAINLLPKSLSFVSIVDNRLTLGKYLYDIMSLTNIDTFDGSRQFYSHDPLQPSSGVFDCTNRIPFAAENQRQIAKSVSGSANISYLSSVTFRKDFYITFFIPDNLKTVYFNKTGIRDNIGRFGVNENNSVVHADFSYNIFPSLIGPIYGLQKLEYLDISGCLSSNISTYFFDTLTGLRVLKLRGNYLGYSFSADKNGDIFKSLSILRVLDLSDNRIYDLSQSFFKGLPNLRALYLHNNSLNNFDMDIGHMNKLSVLEVSTNQITSFTKRLMDTIDNLLPNMKINIRNNPIQCNCDNLAFVEWLYKRKSNFQHFRKYQCQLSNLTRISFKHFERTLDLLRKECSSYTGLLVLLVSAVVCFLTVVLAALVYRFRWRLRYMYYMTHNKYRGYKPLVDPDYSDQYLYDAFVSHADEDKEFAASKMSEQLEIIGGFKLCIANRDFQPGSQIAANIAYAINKSRTTIIVMSSDFLKSYWCMYELNMARMESIYTRNGKDILFMVMYRSVPTKYLPLPVMELINNESYIEYPNDEQGNVVFWDKMRQTLS